MFVSIIGMIVISCASIEANTLAKEKSFEYFGFSEEEMFKKMNDIVILILAEPNISASGLGDSGVKSSGSIITSEYQSGGVDGLNIDIILIQLLLQVSENEIKVKITPTGTLRTMGISAKIDEGQVQIVNDHIKKVISDIETAIE